jgi:hypothetical protein
MFIILSMESLMDLNLTVNVCISEWIVLYSVALSTQDTFRKEYNCIPDRLQFFSKSAAERDCVRKIAFINVDQNLNQ